MSRTDPDALAFAGRILCQVPVPYQRPGRTQDRRPRPATPAPAQRPPGSAGVKIQTCCPQVSASQHRTRYPNRHKGVWPRQPCLGPQVAAMSHIRAHSPQSRQLGLGCGVRVRPLGREETPSRRPSQAVARSCAQAAPGWGWGRASVPVRTCFPSMAWSPSWTPGASLPPGQ